MSFIVLAIVLLIVLSLMAVRAVRNRPPGHKPYSLKPRPNGRIIPASGNHRRDGDKIHRQTEPIQKDDYSIWLDILKKEKPNSYDFDLLGTPATILWKDDDPEVSGVCITQFSNGIPKTNKYDHFDFNIKERTGAEQRQGDLLM